MLPAFRALHPSAHFLTIIRPAHQSFRSFWSLQCAISRDFGGIDQRHVGRGTADRPSLPTSVQLRWRTYVAAHGLELVDAAAGADSVRGHRDNRRLLDRRCRGALWNSLSAHPEIGL